MKYLLIAFPVLFRLLICLRTSEFRGVFARFSAQKPEYSGENPTEK
jgi:hypothetical protein